MSRERMSILCLLLFAVLLCQTGSALAADEARSEGEVEDCEGNVEINEGGLSIGSIRNNGGEMKNVRRCTKLDNVTIINNGKTTVYRKNAKTVDGEKGQERR